jgi:hypothetical protein
MRDAPPRLCSRRHAAAVVFSRAVDLRVVAFCRSDSVTGQVLNIDGGVFFH